jgi:hypothetical protein
MPKFDPCEDGKFTRLAYSMIYMITAARIPSITEMTTDEWFEK